MSGDINKLAHRIVQHATAEGTPDMEASISQLIEADEHWADVIRTCVDWAVTQREKGQPESFTRETIYYRMGRNDGAGPPLTPLWKVGILAKDFDNSRGKPYYNINGEPSEILRALSRAVGKAG